MLRRARFVFGCSEPSNFSKIANARSEFSLDQWKW